MACHRILTGVTLVGQELLTLPKYLSYVGIAPSLVFCVVFGRPLYCLFLFFFSLYCLSFELRLLITTFVSVFCVVFGRPLYCLSSDYTISIIKPFSTHCIIDDEIYVKSRTFFRYPGVAAYSIKYVIPSDNLTI